MLKVSSKKNKKFSKVLGEFFFNMLGYLYYIWHIVAVAILYFDMYHRHKSYYDSIHIFVQVNITLPSMIFSHYWNSVFDEYDFHARIQIRIYSGRHFLANTNTNIFGLTFFGEYKCIQIPFFRRRWIQIYSGLPKMGEYEYKYNYSDWYSRIQIRIQILSHPKLTI